MASLYTSAGCRELDRLMIEQQGMSGFELMRQAGQAAFAVLLDRWPAAQAITLFCGRGNNAGDGYIIAGLARQLGLEVQVLQVGAGGLQGDALRAQAWAQDSGVAAQAADSPLHGQVIVDALLGTGLRGGLRAPFTAAIGRINAAGLPVLAVDLPSGVNADTGAAPDGAVRADITVSFIGPKLGLHTGAGLAMRGELVQRDLGVTPALLAQVPSCPLLTFAAAALPPLAVNQHKHQMGRLVVVGGDHGMGGAPLMAAEAALRTGTGLVTVLTRPEHQAALLARRPELMVRDAGDEAGVKAALSHATALVVGPGLGRSPWGEKLFRLALAAAKPRLIDADGLRWLADAAATLKQEPGAAPLVITPHVGEAAQLLGVRAGEVEANRPAAARRLAKKYNGVAVLKGAGTLCADAAGTLLGLCAHGNPGMASAGMGDVLAGVIGGLLAQGVSAPDAATLGASLHGRAADIASERLSQRGLLAVDLMEPMAALLR